MKLSALHPELQLAFRFLPGFPLHNRSFLKLCNLIIASVPRPSKLGRIAIADHKLSTALVRTYRPPPPRQRGALRWIHGGGMITGSTVMDDKLCARFAQELSITVASVEYRLAPEHPYPAAIDDCFAAWRWLLESADVLAVDPRRIVISGQSAGGGLAACLAQRIRDQGGCQPAGVALLSPMLDDRPAANVALDALKHRVWNNKNNRAGWTAYLARRPGLPDAPAYAVAARCLDLSGLPPTWIATSDIDLLFEEADSFRTRLEAAGVACGLHVVSGAPHGFEALLPRSRLALELFRENCAFLRERMVLS